MPRQSRIDTPGALHHIIVRGNEKRRIFEDNSDRQKFLIRLGGILIKTDTICYAWALIPNHFHLLLRTGNVPIATVMHRLLTGHAVYFNKRHHRYGHLFQNRYKSILCQEDPYFLELVRYIHLNPIRAQIVKDISSLDKYPYSGHCALMGRCENEWQDTGYVLKFFGKRINTSRSKYRGYVQKGISMGRRPDLMGGGLIRSVGGWVNLIELRNAKEYIKGDERILGEGNFVEEILKRAEEEYEKKTLLMSQGWDVDKIADHVSKLLGMETWEVWSEGKYRRIVKARSLLCYWAVRELGVTMSSLSRRLNLSSAAISKSVIRGEMIVRENQFSFP